MSDRERAPFERIRLSPEHIARGLPHEMIPPNVSGQYNCMSCGEPWPCPSERSRRRLEVELAFADMRIDGLHPSERSVRDAEEYVAGESTLEELIERAKRDFGGGSGE